MNPVQRTSISPSTSVVDFVPWTNGTSDMPHGFWGAEYEHMGLAQGEGGYL